MKVEIHSPSDAIIDGRVKKLSVGEHDLPESVARKLKKNGVASFVSESTATKATKPTKAASDEA
jgi:hypothetical protein